MRSRPVLAVATACAALAGAGLSAAPASAARSCAPVEHLLAGTSDEGDLTSIKATKVSCRTARSVARGAWLKASASTPTGPVRTLTYEGWKVRGDLRGAKDRYTATKGGRRITWRA
ncbi:hypothetical protein [Patulibacter minatonensis]|uniref:hypothetical protein n=1 Tax=Patulibacter minatonensis TaxID=298163 RepID=UPI00047C9FB7|nr:hypothetical protein [Patulibacter minatonensis]